jgi:hypothetical protein
VYGDKEAFKATQLITPVFFIQTISSGVRVEFFNNGGGEHGVGYGGNSGDLYDVYIIRADGTSTTPRNVFSSGSQAAHLGDTIVLTGRRLRTGREYSHELRGTHTAFSGQPYRLTIDGQMSFPPGLEREMYLIEAGENEFFFGANLMLDYINRGQGARPFEGFIRARYLANRMSGFANSQNHNTFLAMNNSQEAYYNAILAMLRNEMHHSSVHAEEGFNSIFDALIRSLIPSVPVSNPLPLSGEMKRLLSFTNLIAESVSAPVSGSERLTLYEVTMLMKLRESALSLKSQNNNMVAAIDKIINDFVSIEELNQMRINLERAQIAAQAVTNEKLSELQNWALEQLDLALAFKALAYFPRIDDAAREYVNVPRDRIHALDDIRQVVWVIWDKIIEEGKTEGFTEERLERAYEIYMLSRYLILEQISWAAPMMDGPSNFVEVFRNNNSKWAQDDWIQDDWKYALEMWNPANYHQFSQFTRTTNAFQFIRFYNDGRVLAIGDVDWRSALRNEGQFSINGDTLTVNWSRGSPTILTISQNGNIVTEGTARYELSRGLPLQSINILSARPVDSHSSWAFNAVWSNTSR